ncbi:MAG: BamA/TamA family outer membrane protein [Sandaracinaceae bacterium]|nr:BamA/TamA family outer membrane protein [Myxococcales bacterium]MCB9658103.1 BamA/TamA family outer membrane protein [Sandaracinaceae bacterium]
MNPPRTGPPPLDAPPRRRTSLGRSAFTRTTVWALASSALWLWAGCATIPRDSYGVHRLRFEGVEDLDANALAACLATRERSSVGIDFGTASDPTCGEPPFDGGTNTLRLWRWPWSDWPTWDLSVFERDLRRIERWYRARGYYDAEVVHVEITPEAAAESDRVEGDGDDAPCERNGRNQGCEVEVTVHVSEGEPVVTRQVVLLVSHEQRANPASPTPPPPPTSDDPDAQSQDEGQTPAPDASEESAAADPDAQPESASEFARVADAGLPQSIASALTRAIELEPDAPFDEAIYERSKRALSDALAREGYACGHVEGRVDINRDERLADVKLWVRLGPQCVVSSVTVEGDDVPTATIRGTADIRRGAPYSEQAMRVAQRAVYGLGAFAEVDVIGNPRRDEAGLCTGEVDVTIRVRRGRNFRYGVGVGVETGQVVDEQNTSSSTPQWDAHVLAFVEHRDFLGGLRRVRLEDRPRLIFQTRSENGIQPRFGNVLKLEFRQPAFIESRTTLTLNSHWDLGPDPNQGFFRHDVDAAVRVSRPFFGGKLILSGGLHSNLQRTTDQVRSSDYSVLFFEEYAQVDLRDDSRSPHQGFFLSLGFHQAPAFLGSSWTYYRFTPEARAYAPLPLNMVLAARFGLGVMLIRSADQSLDQVSALLGPQRYRLRGGGPSSHRGFAPGFLGDQQAIGVQPACARNNPPPDTDCSEANSGGLRRWEASIELRAPITPDFGVVLFADMGDVNRGDRFRFDQIHLAAGFGLRYQTLVGPVRLDIGFLSKRAQVVGGGVNLAPINYVNLGFVRFPGAIHLTIGEAF